MKRIAAFLASVFFCLSVIAAETTAQRVTIATYSGWHESLTMRGGECQAVVVPAVGGRVLSYSINGENIIYETATSAGKTLSNAPAGFSVGGYQCDIGPELRGIPPHRHLWQGIWSWRTPRDFTVETFSEPDPNVGVQLEKEFVIDPESGELGITQRMRNTATNVISFCLWDRTLCKPNGFALLPLNRQSRFKARWSMRRGTKPGNYTYDGDQPSDPRARIMDDILVVEARDRPELKVGADSEAGWVAYVRGNVLFVKYFPVESDGRYTDGGNSVEFYCNDRIAEVEPLSPEVTLRPGQTYQFPEKWALIRLREEVRSFKEARAVVKRIPRSPFPAGVLRDGKPPKAE